MVRILKILLLEEKRKLFSSKLSKICVPDCAPGEPLRLRRPGWGVPWSSGEGSLRQGLAQVSLGLGAPLQHGHTGGRGHRTFIIITHEGHMRTMDDGPRGLPEGCGLTWGGTYLRSLDPKCQRSRGRGRGREEDLMLFPKPRGSRR